MDPDAHYRIEQVCPGGSLWRLLENNTGSTTHHNRAHCAWTAVQIGDETMVEKPVLAHFLKNHGFKIYRGRFVRPA